MPITQTQQDPILQKAVNLATGSAANTRQMAQLNSMVAEAGGVGTIDALVDNYLKQVEARQGVTVKLRALAKNGCGVTPIGAEAQQTSADLQAAGIDSWPKLINVVIAQQTSNSDALGATLDNRFGPLSLRAEGPAY